MCIVLPPIDIPSIQIIIGRQLRLSPSMTFIGFAKESYGETNI